jgi:flagellar biosynthesis/type III secretory pathway protein FliH
MRRRQAPADLELRAELMRRVLTSRLEESPKYQLANLIETYFTLTDEARQRYRQLISREEYRQVQEVEQTYFDQLREEGLEKGRAQGKREALKRQLAKKFGPLSADVDARIDGVTSADEFSLEAGATRRPAGSTLASEYALERLHVSHRVR